MAGCRPIRLALFRKYGVPDTPQPIYLISLIVMTFVLGIASVWLYAAIRPRFGPGAATAVCAGLAVWVIAHVWSGIYLWAGFAGLIPASWRCSRSHGASSSRRWELLPGVACKIDPCNPWLRSGGACHAPRDRQVPSASPGAPGHGALPVGRRAIRAALFHLGGLRRLNELGVLSRIDAISSVSGGSIMAAHLADRVRPWPEAGDRLDASEWNSRVAEPFYALASRDLRMADLEAAASVELVPHDDRGRNAGNPTNGT